MRAFEYQNPILTEFEKSKQQLINMYHRLERIIHDSEQYGEVDNAQRLLDKVLAQLKQQHNWTPPQKTSNKQQEPKAKRSGKHQAAIDAYQQTQGNQFKMMFLGYDPKNKKQEPNNIWGWGILGDNIYQFWGTVDQMPQVKKMDDMPFNRRALLKKQEEKLTQGYKKISGQKSIKWVKRILGQDLEIA